jgi:hypothetical protein
VVESQVVAKHIDNALLQRLEVRRFGDGKKKPRGKKVPAGQSYTAEIEDSSEENDLGSEEEEDDPVSEEEQAEDEEEQAEDEEEQEELPDLDRPIRKAGTFVVALYEGQWFLAEVCADQKNVGKGYVRLNYMVLKGTNCFAWGAKPDLVVTLEEDIILDGVVPEPLNSRGHWGLTKNDLKKIPPSMVVVYLPILLTFFVIFLGFFKGRFYIFGNGK